MFELFLWCSRVSFKKGFYSQFVFKRHMYGPNSDEKMNCSFKCHLFTLKIYLVTSLVIEFEKHCLGLLHTPRPPDQPVKTDVSCSSTSRVTELWTACVLKQNERY